MSILDENFVLNNGVKIPKLGIGTWQVSPEDVKIQVKNAIKVGYRHIDTASQYGNESAIGDTLRKIAIPREEIFITTKVPADCKDAESTRKVIDESLNNLKLDYIDLLLIHSPKPWEDLFAGVEKTYFEENIEVWNVMIEYLKKGKVKAIGVSNFAKEDIENLITNTEIKPVCNQIKVCIGKYPKELIEFCKSENILVEAFSPISTGDLLKDNRIIKMADKYNVSVPQLAIKYVIQKDIATFPKAKEEEHLKQNAELDFIISNEDIKYLDNLEDVKMQI